MTQNLAHLFSTNDAPSETEIASLLQEIDALNAEIQLLSPSERPPLEGQMYLRRCALSPTRRIPPEVLEQILVYVDEKDVTSVVLVSRAWHAGSSAKATRLYSTLRVRLLPGERIPCSRIHSWLAQTATTANRCLQLVAEGCKCTGRGEWCCWTDLKFLDLLVDLSSSSIELDIHIPLCCLFKLICTIYSYITSPSEEPVGPAWRSFASLKLTISPIPWEHWHVYDSYAHCLGRLPRGLKSFSLSVQPYDTPLDFEPQFYRKPFATLTHLALNCMWNAPIVVPNLVRNCVNLETLRLHFICGDADSAGQAGQPVEGSKLILPKLHTLELHNVEPYMADMADMADMLRELLQLSTLAHVTIKCTSIRVSDKLALWNPLDGLRLRSPSQGARLHFLKLGRMKLDFTALTDVFVNLPFLEHLLLERVTFDTRDSELVAIGLKRFRIGAVDSTLQDQPILPRLTRLELREIEGGSSTHAFLEYIQLRALRFRELREVSGEDSNSRWNGNDELRRITIKYHLWSEETKADWENCSSIVSNLRRDFGLVVERMVNESEWLDFTGNQYASVGESGNGEDDRQ